jgi:ubiquitin-activating enzyme E1
MNSTIDINLYDRQVRTYGLEAVQKMNTSSVLIYGLASGLATEVAKNLALGGIKTIYLYDDIIDNIVTINDLKTGYYYQESNIGQLRSEVLAKKIQELNPYIQVIPVRTYKMEQQVTCLINQPTNYIKEFANYSRNYVVLFSKGVSGVIFVDATSYHLVNDVTGENIDPVQIGSISESGLVQCAQYSKHDYQTGDIITFTNVQGTNVDWLSKKEWTIKVINTTKFQITNWIEKKDWSLTNATAIYKKQTMIVNIRLVVLNHMNRILESCRLSTLT